uniref:Uncharacterized protein n=1 Tax=Cannabis sativa TaxID=3483 RepID=A0A803P9Z6_CANSA
MTIDRNVRVPTTTGVSMNLTDAANPANLASPRNLANTSNPIAPANLANPTCPRIREPTIGESHVDLGEDIELARFREVVDQVDQSKEPRAIGCDAFTKQRYEFLRQLNERTMGIGQDLIRYPLQVRLIDRSGRVYNQVENRKRAKPSPLGMRTNFPLPQDGKFLRNQSYGRNRQSLAPSGVRGGPGILGSNGELMPPPVEKSKGRERYAQTLRHESKSDILAIEERDSKQLMLGEPTISFTDGDANQNTNGTIGSNRHSTSVQCNDRTTCPVRPKGSNINLSHVAKILKRHGVGCLRGDQQSARHCYNMALSKPKKEKIPAKSFDQEHGKGQ